MVIFVTILGVLEKSIYSSYFEYRALHVSIKSNLLIMMFQLCISFLNFLFILSVTERGMFQFPVR